MANLNSLLLLAYFLFANSIFVGAALFYWAKPISEQYNAWTARIRQRFPKINEPPDRESSQMNFRIIVFFCRFCGVVLFASGIYFLFHAFNRSR